MVLMLTWPMLASRPEEKERGLLLTGSVPDQTSQEVILHPLPRLQALSALSLLQSHADHGLEISLCGVATLLILSQPWQDCSVEYLLRFHIQDEEDLEGSSPCRVLRFRFR